LGENIADQGGLLVSYEALKSSFQGKEPAAIDGFTATQRFYLGYAALWGQNIRNEEILRLTKIDPHSLGKWRVNAALRNVDDFYKAFNITENDALKPPLVVLNNHKWRFFNLYSGYSFIIFSFLL
jgi:putative endopeptidase